MRVRPYVVTAIALTALALTQAAASPVSAAVGTPTSLVVDTQFWDAPSDIVAATGPLSVCTEVTDEGNVANQVGPHKVQFSGDKVLACDGAEVVIHYDAVMNFEAGRRTFGDWYVVSSTLDGVDGGSGTVKGDGRACTPAEGSGGCILDTFTGRVY